MEVFDDELLTPNSQSRYLRTVTLKAGQLYENAMFVAFQKFLTAGDMSPRRVSRLISINYQSLVSITFIIFSPSLLLPTKKPN